MAKIIPVLWCSATLAWGAGDLSSLVRAYRESPTRGRKAAVESFAVTHPKQAPLAALALGVAAYEQKDFPAAIANLKRAKVSALADYVAYYLQASRVELKDTAGVADGLVATHKTAVASPLAGKAWIVEARALGADGVNLLRAHYSDLPQPEGDVALADAYQAAGDLPHAVEFYQRVFYSRISGDAEARAAAALLALKDSMGASYPQPLPQQALRRADLLLGAGRGPAARSEYEALLDQLVSPERDQARVRMGAADLISNKPGIAAPYLRGLDLPDGDADAERLYWLEECARRMDDETAMNDAVAQLGAKYPKSEWRLKAMVGAANKFLVTNRPDSYLPLYEAAYKEFPNARQAGLYHWKVAFQAYLRGRDDAGELLREQLRNYADGANAGAALYFLGRQAEQAHDPGAARAFYQRLTRVFPNQFYAMEAAERLKQPEIAGATSSDEAERFLAGVKFDQPDPVPASPAPATTQRIERSRLLRSAGLVDFADTELRFGARNGGQKRLLGMEMASAADSPYQALRAMKSLGGDYLALPLPNAPRRFWEMLFPMPWRTEIERDARARGVDPFLMAGLIRQESEFNPQAVSGARAYGLMQVQPATARGVARRAGVPRVNTRILVQPAANLKIGSYVLRSMLDRCNGKLEETLASYNAGPNRVAEWRTWGSYRERAEFIESIPFTETRDYVQAVLRNAEMYRRLYK